MQTCNAYRKFFDKAKAAMGRPEDPDTMALLANTILIALENNLHPIQLFHHARVMNHPDITKCWSQEMLEIVMEDMGIVEQDDEQSSTHEQTDDETVDDVVARVRLDEDGDDEDVLADQPRAKIRRSDSRGFLPPGARVLFDDQATVAQGHGSYEAN